MSDTTATRDEQVAHLADLVEAIEFCMLTTIDDDGKPWSRPMDIQNDRFDGTLWFFTRDDSEKVAHVRRNANVGVAFAKPSDQDYVTMVGTAAVVKDRQKAEQLWSPDVEAWFDGGLDDPHLCLLRVDVERAEYWDAPDSFVMYALAFAKAKLTGEPADDIGDNEKVDV